jgi:hypothetical protein
LQEYYRGDAMGAAVAAGARSAFGGYLPVPTAGQDGRCLESSFGHFMEPVRGNECVRAVKGFLDADGATSDKCEVEFDARRFAELR